MNILNLFVYSFNKKKLTEFDHQKRYNFFHMSMILTILGSKCSLGKSRETLVGFFEKTFLQGRGDHFKLGKKLTFLYLSYKSDFVTPISVLNSKMLFVS